MNLSINDFRSMIGEHSLGYVEFNRNASGEVTGLKKVANHKTLKFLNESETSIAARLGGQNAHEIRHAFVEALRNELGANLPGDVVRSLLFSLSENESDVNSKPLSRREIRAAIDQVDAVKRNLVASAHEDVTRIAVQMGAAETLSNGEASPLIACAKEGYVAFMSSIKDCFRQGHDQPDEFVLETFKNCASKFRDVCDRYRPKLGGLQQQAAHMIIIRTLLEKVPELRDWAMNNREQLNRTYNTFTDLADEASDLPGAEGNDPSPEGVANMKKMIDLSEGRQIMSTLTDMIMTESQIAPIAGQIANEFAETVGATADEIAGLMKRMVDAETLKGNPRQASDMIPQLRSLMSGFAEIRSREAQLHRVPSTFARLVSLYADTPAKILALDFRIAEHRLNAFARTMKEDLVKGYKKSAAERSNWANISAVSMREANPGGVKINGVAVPDEDNDEFTLDDGTVVNNENVNKINNFTKAPHSGALVKSLVRNIPDKKMRGFVSTVISMSLGPHGTFDSLFHGTDEAGPGHPASNMMTMLSSGTFVTQVSNESTYEINIADDGTVTVTAHTNEGFAISGTTDGPLALKGEDPIRLRIPLVSQKYETTITIKPNSFDAEGIPEFTVATKPVD